MLRDLRAHGVEIVTLGQYLRPTRQHEPVDRYLPPEAFDALAAEARAIGSRRSTRASSCAPRTTRSRSSSPGARADRRPAARGARGALGRAAGPVVPEVRERAVAWVALVPLLVALHGATGWRAARLGYVTGAVSAIGLLYWTALVVFQYGGGIPRVVAVLITLALCFAFAVFPLLFGWATGRLVAAFGTRGSARRALPVGGDGAPARPHLLRVPLVPARLQPAAVPAGDPDRVGHGRLRRVVRAGRELDARSRSRSSRRATRRSALAGLVALLALAWGRGALRLAGPCARRAGSRSASCRAASARKTSGCRRTPGATSAATSS